MELADAFSGVGTGLLTGGLSLLGAQLTAQQSHSENEWAMRESERLSSTAYQRATADLRAAGLNPMLAYMNGGASSPQAVGGQPADLAGAVTSGVSSAASAVDRMLAAKRNQAEIKLMSAETNKSIADALHKMESVKNLSTAREVDLAQAALAASNKALAKQDFEFREFGRDAARKRGKLEGTNAHVAARGAINLFRPLMPFTSVHGE